MFAKLNRPPAHNNMQIYNTTTQLASTINYILYTDKLLRLTFFTFDDTQIYQ